MTITSGPPPVEAVRPPDAIRTLDESIEHLVGLRRRDRSLEARVDPRHAA